MIIIKKVEKTTFQFSFRFRFRFRFVYPSFSFLVYLFNNNHHLLIKYIYDPIIFVLFLFWA
jgi:hypothetical protein